MNYSAHSQYSTNCDEKLVRHSTIYQYITYCIVQMNIYCIMHEKGTTVDIFVGMEEAVLAY